VRRDRGEYEGHAVSIVMHEVEQLSPLRLTEYSHGAG
jgi:hypothetical protein